jgi:hypothetical protein
MKSLKISALSLALLVSQAQAMEAPLPTEPVVVEAIKEVATSAKVAAKSFNVGEFIGSVKAKLPAMPARPTAQEVKASLANAKDTVVAYAHAHPKTTAIFAVATAAAVVYAVYKVCTAKKAKNTKVVVVK